MRMRRSLILACVGMLLLPALLPLSPASPVLAQRRAPAAASSGLGEYKSANFILRTDLTAEESKELLDRLETMLGLISRYWGKRNAGVIEMYVVEDLSKWADGLLPPDGRQSIAQGGGLTKTVKRSLGRAWQAKSVVYAVADRGTPQHEAVHAYCSQAFGSTGPVWYSEGMAEVGQYWRDADGKAVTANPNVIRYLKSNERKPLKELVDVNQFTGDSWQNYAWRWSLCHLLGFNDNYSARFKPLGLALMAEQPGVSFWSVYGSMAQEIDFEHKLFIENMDVGYRVDLCAWDWKTKFQGLRGSRRLTSRIEADHGWQASRLEAEAGATYTFEASGEWTIEEDGDELTADGNEDGAGRLMGVLFNDYELSEPFELGANGQFTAEQDGQLFVRCRDDWTKLADNKGVVTLKLTRAE
ncbi:hypothetical protein GYB59_05135 [bacterium]|nr:hypothetical protein [bacterium]